MYLLPVYIVIRIIVAQFCVFYKALVVTEPQTLICYVTTDPSSLRTGARAPDAQLSSVTAMP